MKNVVQAAPDGNQGTRITLPSMEAVLSFLSAESHLCEGFCHLLSAFHTDHFLLTHKKNVNVQLGLNEIRKVNAEMIGTTENHLWYGMSFTNPGYNFVQFTPWGGRSAQELNLPDPPVAFSKSLQTDGSDSGERRHLVTATREIQVCCPATELPGVPWTGEDKAWGWRLQTTKSGPLTVG